jgi:hypothetical protein
VLPTRGGFPHHLLISVLVLVCHCHCFPRYFPFALNMRPLLQALQVQVPAPKSPGSPIWKQIRHACLIGGFVSLLSRA